VADVAIEHTSLGGNNCPEIHAPQHVTRITTRTSISAGAAMEAFVMPRLG